MWASRVDQLFTIEKRLNRQIFTCGWSFVFIIRFVHFIRRLFEWQSWVRDRKSVLVLGQCGPRLEMVRQHHHQNHRQQHPVCERRDTKYKRAYYIVINTVHMCSAATEIYITAHSPTALFIGSTSICWLIWCAPYSLIWCVDNYNTSIIIFIMQKSSYAPQCSIIFLCCVSNCNSIEFGKFWDLIYYCFAANTTAFCRMVAN